MNIRTLDRHTPTVPLGGKLNCHTGNLFADIMRPVSQIKINAPNPESASIGMV